MTYTRHDGGAAALGFALRLLGKPYVYGGSWPTSGGTDCSGLVQWAYAQVGVSLPRTTYQQYRIEPRAIDEPRAAGDLVFFRGSDPGPDGEPGHVGIYVGVGIIGADQHSYAPTIHGAPVMFNAPYTDDPYGIRYDLVSAAGPVIAVTRPALLLPASAPEAPKPVPAPTDEEEDMLGVIVKGSSGGEHVAAGDLSHKHPIPEGEVVAALVASEKYLDLRGKLDPAFVDAIPVV